MGAFKPLLPFGGRPVAEVCVENLRAAGAGEIVVVAGHRAPELRAALAHLGGLRFALNAEAGSGMGVSIARGVEQVSGGAGAVLVALVDQPAAPPDAIRRVIEERAARGALLAVPQWRGRGGHPVIIDLTLRRELLDLDPAEGLRGLFDAHRAEVLRVPVESPYVLRDMDTWDDYRALHEEVFGHPPPAAAP